MSPTRVAIGLVVLGALTVVDGAVGQQRSACPDIPLFALIPHGACPLAAPRCSTDYGVCRYPVAFASPGQEGLADILVKPGLPCQCQAPNGAWVGGIIR